MKRYILGAIAIPIGIAFHYTQKAFDAISGLRVSRASRPDVYGGTAWAEYPLNPCRIEWTTDARGRYLYVCGYNVTNEFYHQKWSPSSPYPRFV